MNCDILKIVRGNDFATQMTITALDAGGNVIEDFSLEESTEVVVKYTLAGTSHTIEAYDYDIEGNDITIQWSDLTLGKYGFEIEGKFNGYSWRSAARFIFQIVADNASANIPDGVLVDGIYKLSDWLRLLSGTGGVGKQVQADWTETDTESPAYIQNKPDLNKYATDTELQQGLATKQDVIQDLATIRSEAAEGAAALEGVENIETLIPSQASSSNQLADKNFVNNQVSTNTANFVGTYDSLAELQAVQNPTNNDYGFVIETDAQGNEYYDRYKYNGSQWLFEYKVESTPFTAEQWAAIQSGITSGKVAKLDNLPTSFKTINGQSIEGPGDIEVGGALDSVNGKTGVVVLDAEDVGAASAEDLQDVADDVATNAEDIATLQAAYAGLTQSDIVPLTSLPASGVANTIYRIAGTNSYTDYMWNDTEFIPMATYTIPADAGVYDISAEHSGATYDNLTAALGTNGANVPSAVRTGGMSIKYLENVYADYSVVVTEGLTTAPTGTLLESAPAITDGTYKAAQLSAFATLPTNPYNSITYYIGVTEDGVTTYTQWVVMKMTNDSAKYMHWTYTNSSTADVDIVNLGNWIGSAEAEAELIDEKISDSEWVNIPFDGGNYYMNNSNQIVSNNSWRSTKFIPVKEGDRLMYSGSPSTTSKALVGFAYDGTDYVPKIIYLGANKDTYKNYPEVVTKGITHVRAFCSKSSLDGGTAKLVKYKTSVLADLIDNIGEVSKTRIYYRGNFTNGSYINTSGNIGSSSSYYLLLTDVKAGDIIILYSWSTTTTISAIAKQLTSTEFQPLLVSNEEGTKKYTVEEDMTIAISCHNVNHVEIYSNKFANLDVSIATLNAKQVANEQYQAQMNQYDLKLGYMFNNIAVIGDSMSVGSISTEATEAPNSRMNASWLSILAKRWGCVSRKHYAIGGSACYSWLNSDEGWGLGAMLRDTRIFNCYLIAYGHNDGGSNYSGVGEATDTAATVTISGTTPSCASGNTFCAYYKAVINQIRTKAPNAMIFCLSEYDNVVRTKSDGTYRKAIIDVADWYYTQGDHLVYHLETGGVPNSDMSLGSHYSTVGYFHIAMRVDQEANKAIYEHMSDMQIKEFGIYNNGSDRYLEYVMQ